jgi:SacI homology domain
MRGSIPTYWYQETSVTMPKPPILVNRIDPAYLATQEHFSDLFVRYNSPVIVLDLVKHYERRPREVIVGREYRQAVEVLNTSIPLSKQIRYLAMDYTKINKSKAKSAAVNGGVGGGGGVVGTGKGGMAVVGQEWASLEKSFGETLVRADYPVFYTNFPRKMLCPQ